MKIGVIGTGVMGKNHVRVYSRIRGIQDIFVFDPKKKNMEALKNYEVIICNSLRELITKVDAVSICVPTEYHFKVAREVLGKKIHCLIEKPFTSTLKEGKELLGMMCDDTIVGVGHIERFNPIVDEIKKVANNIRYCEIKRYNPDSERITDVNVVKDLMIHDIDIIFNVLFKERKYLLSSLGNQDICSTLIKFDDSIVSLTASKASSRKIRSIYIEDEEFSVNGDFMQQEVYLYRKPEKYTIKDERYLQENIIEKILLNKVEPLFIELNTFLDCIKKHFPFPVTPEQAYNNLKICEEIGKECQ